MYKVEVYAKLVEDDQPSTSQAPKVQDQENTTANNQGAKVEVPGHIRSRSKSE